MLLASYNATYQQPLEGLTKLAKLDFLVRYPSLLEELARKVTDQSLPESVKPTDSERLGVENRMVRYKYGPWDDRYYPILGMLLGLDLVVLASPAPRSRLRLQVTEEGAAIAAGLSSQPSWMPVARRCEFVITTFDMTGNRLKELIYQELPVINSTRYRRPI